MKLHNRNLPTVIAGILAITSVFWALVVGALCVIALFKSFSEPVLLLSVIYFIPGWIAFIGWWTRYKKEDKIKRRKLFWAASTGINIFYFISWMVPYGLEYGIPQNWFIPLHWWWSFAILMSLIGLFTEKHIQTELSTPLRAPRSIAR